MAKDYYIVLGMSNQQASQEEIKAAYRKRAKEFHPDRSGQGSADFLEIQEAYDVLGDPERRREHDRRLQRDSDVFHSGKRAAEPMRPRRRPAESIFGSVGDPGFEKGTVEDFVPSWEEDGLGSMPWMDRSMPREELSAKVVLSADQARRGGQTRVLVPLEVICDQCRGHGCRGPYVCYRCRGEGIQRGDCPVTVPFPVNTPEFYTVRIPLERYQINGRLTVHFQVR